jgi:hypothetical protein
MISNNGHPVSNNIDNIMGLGWNTFFEGIKKGADKLGITSIIENATGSAI